MSFDWDALQDSLDLDAVLDELGILVREVKRGEHMASCPLPSHPGVDANPSFSVNEDKLVWNCFTCDEGGSLPTLVSKLLDLEYEESLRWLLPFTDFSDGADEGFIEAIERAIKGPEKPPKRFRNPPLPSLSTRVLEKLKPAPIELLEKWNIHDPVTAIHFQVKYDPERIRGSYSGPALIIPHFVNGDLVGYQERWLDDDRPKSIPKYTNTTDFPRAETLFNIDSERTQASVIVVESVMTVMRLYDAGYSAVSTFGASVKEGQLRQLGAFRAVVLAYDNDPAGRKATKKITEAIGDHTEIFLMPFVPANKGDLADLDVDELENIMNNIKPFTIA